MKKILVLLIAAGLLILNLGLLMFIAFRAKKVRHLPEVKAALPHRQPLRSLNVGEKIVYEVCLGFLTIGKAVFTHNPDVPWGAEGEFASSMTFETNVTSFRDREEIYSDIASGLPLKIMRDIQMLTGAEKITEHYDQKDFKLTISKVKKGSEAKTDDLILQKKGPIHNAILLPFYLRRLAELKVGWSFVAVLPTKEFNIRLAALEKIKTPAGEFETFRFESTPRQFEIWISSDKRRLPVKIKGSGLGAYYMIMKEYFPPSLSDSTNMP